MVNRIVNSVSRNNKGYDLHIGEGARDNVFINSDMGRTKIEGQHNAFINSRVGLVLQAVKATPWWYSLGVMVAGAVLGVIFDRLASYLLHI